MRPRKGTKTIIVNSSSLIIGLFIKMRPRKGTKTWMSILFIFTDVIYKDETPEGDENLFIKTDVVSLKIYKDETPEGDENHYRRLREN